MRKRGSPELSRNKTPDRKKVKKILKIKQEVIYAEQGEGHKFVEYPHIAETTGLGCCIGLLIYDRRSRAALIAHMVNPMLDSSELKSMLAEASRRFTDKSSLVIYIAGGSIESQAEAKKRIFVIEEISKLGLNESQIHIQWQEPWEVTNLSLDTSSGEIKYDMSDD